MGAESFWSRAHGETASKAFSAAVEQAAWEHGHGGYTGTIAEKDSFKIVKPPEGMSPSEYANQLMDDEESFVQDKWGDAGCIEIKKGEYLFFGYASS